MKQTRLLMGMPITIEIVDSSAERKHISKVFAYFKYIDNKFSTYKKDSEISQINRGKLAESSYSPDMKKILKLCEITKKETNGYFEITNNKGLVDPSGLVKGWAIYNAAEILRDMSFKNYYIDAGGDIEVYGKNSLGKSWTIGIRNPFNRNEIVKVVILGSGGIATSGTYIRGQHIYNPFRRKEELTDVLSLTVIGPNIYDADRFASAAFAMGKAGISFIENLEGFEGYMIDKDGVAIMTSGFNKYLE